MWVYITILFGIIFYFQLRMYNKLENQQLNLQKNESENNKLQENIIVHRQPVFNVPTQHIDAYRQIGVLYSQGSVLPLLGRRVHNGSTNWNYYTLTNDAMSLRIPIQHENRVCTDTHGCKELYDGDTVTIHELGSTFTVRMYNETPYVYNPHVY